jgi:plastocyanin
VQLRPLLLLVVLAAAAAVAAVALPKAGGADNPMLVADVGANDSFVITLKDAQGNPVQHLDPGSYTLLVHDRSSIHNFDLFGPGVSVKTDIGAIGDSTFTITLADGTYNFVCDAHPTTMKGSFTVGTVSTPPPAPKPPKARKLSGSVGPGATIALRPLAGLKAGPATVTVRDRSASDNFRLAGPGVAKATGVKFRGTVTWKVRFRAGKYVYRSDAHPTLRHAFAVRSSSG